MIHLACTGRARFAGSGRVGRRCGRARRTKNDIFNNCGGRRSTRDRLADETLWVERRNEPEISYNVTDSLENDGVLCWIMRTGSWCAILVYSQSYCSPP